jgi:hypothetical protein
VDRFDLLRELNPVDTDDLRDAASSPRAQNTLEQILAGTRPLPKAARWWRRFRRRTYVLILIPAAAAIASVAWALSQGATQQLTVGCYQSADLQAKTVVVPGEGRSPTSSCAAVWQRGDLGHPIPRQLQACVLPTGGIGVFPSPGGRACQRLRLAPLETTATTPSGQAGSVVELKNALVAKFLADRCMSQQRATATVEDELGQLELSAWRVEINGTFTSERPCASLAFDEQHQLVLLVPMPKQP